MKSVITIIVSALFVSQVALAQQHPDRQLHLTTGIGINNILGKLGRTFRSTVAFNSGFEKNILGKLYAQADASFNTLKYDQQIKDDNSPYLFKNTSSSLFMLGANLGRNLFFGESRWHTSIYGGAGYINIGEPRVEVDEINNIVRQDVLRRSGVFGKGGGRLVFETKSKILHTLYFDASCLFSSLKAQGRTVRSVSAFLGMKMAMN